MNRFATQEEWQIAKTLCKNGVSGDSGNFFLKIQSITSSSLQHSFLSISGKNNLGEPHTFLYCLGNADECAYIGQGTKTRAKLIENESGEIFCLKISPASSGDYVELMLSLKFLLHLPVKRERTRSTKWIDHSRIFDKYYYITRFVEGVPLIKITENIKIDPEKILQECGLTLKRISDIRIAAYGHPYTPINCELFLNLPTAYEKIFTPDEIQRIEKVQLGILRYEESHSGCFDYNTHDCLSFALEITMIIGRIHELGWLCIDIKGENFVGKIESENHYVELVDFDSAIKIENASTTGDVKKTSPLYRAPEVKRAADTGTTPPLSIYSDIYSLGRLFTIDLGLHAAEYPWISNMLQFIPEKRLKIAEVIVALRRELLKGVIVYHEITDDQQRFTSSEIQHTTRVRSATSSRFQSSAFSQLAARSGFRADHCSFNIPVPSSPVALANMFPRHLFPSASSLRSAQPLPFIPNVSPVASLATPRSLRQRSDSPPPPTVDPLETIIFILSYWPLTQPHKLKIPDYDKLTIEELYKILSKAISPKIYCCCLWRSPKPYSQEVLLLHRAVELLHTKHNLEATTILQELEEWVDNNKPTPHHSSTMSL